jgi:hypothetical protein
MTTQRLTQLPHTPRTLACSLHDSCCDFRTFSGRARRIASRVPFRSASLSRLDSPVNTVIHRTSVLSCEGVSFLHAPPQLHRLWAVEGASLAGVAEKERKSFPARFYGRIQR